MGALRALGACRWRGFTVLRESACGACLERRHVPQHVFSTAGRNQAFSSLVIEHRERRIAIPEQRAMHIARSVRRGVDHADRLTQETLDTGGLRGMRDGMAMDVSLVRERLQVDIEGSRVAAR